MRRAAALVVLGLAATAWAGELPPLRKLHAASDEILLRPEFVYREPEGPSLLQELIGGFARFVEDFRDQHPALYHLFLGVAVVVLVVLLAHIVWTLRVAGRGTGLKEEDLALEDAVARSDPRPFRDRAVAHADAGRLDDAVRELYLAALLALARRGTLHYARHKAFLDYRIEAASDPVGSRLLSHLGPTYHPGSFGRRPPDRATFDGLLAEVDEVSR